MARMTYVPVFCVEGHDRDCGAQYLEACDCIQGIIRTVRMAFAAELAAAAKGDPPPPALNLPTDEEA